jgi:hypothetical protein
VFFDLDFQNRGFEKLFSSDHLLCPRDVGGLVGKPDDLEPDRLKILASLNFTERERPEVQVALSDDPAEQVVVSNAFGDFDNQDAFSVNAFTNSLTDQ